MNSGNTPSVILFFVDGLGIGKRAESNPFAVIDGLGPLAYFDDDIASPDGAALIPTDACLGVSGRPQSASGQTTIYTGINAPQRIGYHKQGFPNAALREILSEYSIFRQLMQLDRGPAIFANMYTPQFFEKEPRWKSATTCAVEAAGMRFCRLPDMLGRKSVFHDFTNRTLIRKGFKVPEFSPKDAGQILAGLADEYRFVLYEHFITDKIGHDQDWVRAKSHLPELAEFISETLRHIDKAKTTFVLTSDHGNIEDLSVRNHTLNKVPTVVWGREKENFATTISTLADITPAILELLN